MAVKSIGVYDFPSRSRQELYGDDQLVHVWFQGNPWFCAAACYRAPKAMLWSDFWSQLVVPWAEEDPDFDPAGAFAWSLHGEPLTPKDDVSLADLGIEHKDVIGMRAVTGERQP